MTLAELHAKLMYVVGRAYADNKPLPTLFVALDKEQRLHLLPAPDYPEKREFFQLTLRAYFIVHEVTAYAFSSEAWVATMKIKEGEPSPVVPTSYGGIAMREGVKPASEQPNRVEVLMSAAVNKDDIHQEILRIERPKGKPPHLGKSFFDDGGPAPVLQRESLYGLLDTPPPPTPHDLAMLKVVIEAIPDQKYFPGKLILSPAEYDGYRN